MPEQDLQGYFDNPTESGLPDDFDLTIEKVEAAPDVRIDSSGETTFAHIVGGAYRTSEGELVSITEENKVSISLGKKFKSLDGGKTVVHPDGKHKFHQNTHMGEIVEILSKPTEKGGLGLRDTLIKRGLLPTDMRFLVGLTLHWRRDERTYEINGETKKSSKLIPTAFVGENVDVRTGEVGTAPTPAPAETPAAAPAEDPAAKIAAAKAKAEAAKAATNGNGLRDKAVAIAQGAADYAAFQSEVLSLDGITDDDALLAEVVDEGPEGLYAKVKAGA